MALIDTGSTASVISAQLATKLGLKIEHDVKINGHTADGTSHKMGIVRRVLIKVGKKSYATDLAVFPNGISRLILGMNFIKPTQLTFAKKQTMARISGVRVPLYQSTDSDIIEAFDHDQNGYRRIDVKRSNPILDPRDDRWRCFFITTRATTIPAHKTIKVPVRCTYKGAELIVTSVRHYSHKRTRFEDVFLRTPNLLLQTDTVQIPVTNFSNKEVDLKTGVVVSEGQAYHAIFNLESRKRAYEFEFTKDESGTNGHCLPHCGHIPLNPTTDLVSNYN